MTNQTKVIDALYQPSISDLELDEHQGKDRPVVYLDDVKQSLATELVRMMEEALEVKQTIPPTKGEDPDGWDAGRRYPIAQTRTRLAAIIERELG